MKVLTAQHSFQTKRFVGGILLGSLFFVCLWILLFLAAELEPLLRR